MKNKEDKPKNSPKIVSRPKTLPDDSEMLQRLLQAFAASWIIVLLIVLIALKS